MDSLNQSNHLLRSNNQILNDFPNKNLYKNNDVFVYCWGKNKDGELSLGHTKAVTVPKAVKALKNVSIESVSPGGKHSAVVTAEGQLLVAGSTLHGKLGIEELNVNNITRFTKVPAVSHLRVKQVACGDYHTLCLIDNGDVYAWGGTWHKKLGQKGTRPALISKLKNKNIIQIGCGDFHSAALSDSGELYTWGGGGSQYNKGQLGHGHLNDVENPEKLIFFQNQRVKKFSCGGFHMMALTNGEELFGWGSGTFGECGHGEFVDAISPKKVTILYTQKNQMQDEELLFVNDPMFDPKIVDFACGGHHSLILSNKGHVYSCGYNSHGQLGLKNTYNQCDPQLLITLTNKFIVQIAAGWNHSILLSDKGNLFACGYGSSGQLGLGSTESKTIFTEITSIGGKNIEKIYAGGNHSWLIIDEINPINSNYRPSSPLKSLATTPQKNKSKDQLSPNISFENLRDKEKSQLELPEFSFDNNKQERFLQVCYTEVEMCHRFVRFSVNTDKMQNFQQVLNEYFNEISEHDKGILLHNLTPDKDLIQEISDGINLPQRQQYHSNSDKNETNYTLMMIYEPDVINFERENQDQNTTENDNQELAEMFLYKESEILSNQTEKILGKWMLQFLNKFNNVIDNENIKFFELRPKSLRSD